MVADNLREEGLQRLTAKEISITNQHYIVTHFIFNDIQKAVSSYAKGAVLDIGCGNKPYQHLFQNAESYVGCDIAQSSENVVDNICPANELSFSDSSFDTVFCTQVLEHVADFNGVIKESYRVLKPNGIAIFTVPFAWELHEEPYDFHRFSKYGLKYNFEKNGFNVIEIKSNGGKWASVFQLFINAIYSVRKYRTLRAKIVKLLFVYLKLIVPYNLFAIWLDKTFFDDGLTLNYLLVVQKK